MLTGHVNIDCLYAPQYYNCTPDVFDSVTNDFFFQPNSISSFDVNADGRWLVTANKGNLETYSMIIVWNILSRWVYTAIKKFLYKITDSFVIVADL